MKYIISFAFLVIALSVSYYFVIFLPSYKNKEMELTKSKETTLQEQKCGERGTKLYDRKKKESPTLLFFTPEFHFNKKQGKCFYYGGFMQDKYLERWVMNVDTQKTEVSFIENGNKIMSGLNSDEFEKKKKELFEE